MDKWTFFDLLQPACLCCGLGTGSSALLCAGCRASLPRIARPCRRCALPLGGDDPAALPCPACRQAPGEIARLVAPFAYGAPVDRLVQRLKFGGQLPVARELGALVAAHVHAACRDDRLPRALVPVPLHRRRLRQRGFNQAERLATAIGAALDIPVVRRGVQRSRDTAAQSGLDLGARRANLASAFVAGCALPAHVAIVDDVVTTGSTVRALAAALRAAGVARIDAWAVCRTLPGGDDAGAQA